MVQWMRNRQPRYRGGVRLEMERPGPNYIVDVNKSIPRYALPLFWLKSPLDPSPSCETKCAGRRSTDETPTLFPKQSQTSYQRHTVDTRWASPVDWKQRWRIHTVEWHGLQFWDDHAGKKSLSSNILPQTLMASFRHMTRLYGQQFSRTMKIGLYRRTTPV